jgi:hypothetical protein
MLFGTRAANSGRCWTKLIRSISSLLLCNNSVTLIDNTQLSLYLGYKRKVSNSHNSHIQSYKCIRVLCSSGSLCSSSHVRPTVAPSSCGTTDWWPRQLVPPNSSQPSTHRQLLPSIRLTYDGANYLRGTGHANGHLYKSSTSKRLAAQIQSTQESHGSWQWSPHYGDSSLKSGLRGIQRLSARYTIGSTAKTNSYIQIAATSSNPNVVVRSSQQTSTR